MSNTYDAASRRTGMTRRNGDSVTYGYDSIDRLTSVSHPVMLRLHLQRQRALYRRYRRYSASAPAASYSPANAGLGQR